MKKRQGRKKSNKRVKIIEAMQSRLLTTLTEIAKGLTPRKRIKAHVDYYFTCNPVEREFLMTVFRNREDRELTEVAYQG